MRSLVPGTTFTYDADDGSEHNVVEVTHATKVILGVPCIEVHDTVMSHGQLTEDTLDWFSQDVEGNVWYFGEHSEQLEDGMIVGLEGSWEGGVDGAKPGIVMKADPVVEDVYRQEFSPSVAEDAAQILSLSESVTVPFGQFDHCLETKEFSTLEPDAIENKFYALKVGFILSVDLGTGVRLELVSVTFH